MEKVFPVRENKNLEVGNELESNQNYREKKPNSLVLDRLYYLHHQGKNTKIQPVALKGEVYVWRKVTSKIL